MIMSLAETIQQMGSTGNLNFFSSFSPQIIALLVFSIIWKMVWYALALYKSSSKKQKPWFVVLFICMLILNDLGLLAILYLIFNRERKNISKKSKKK